MNMKNMKCDKKLCIFWGSIVEKRAQTIEKIYKNLLMKESTNDIAFYDAQSLFYDFLEALRNVTLPQWRGSLLDKKYILIDGFHYFEQKKSALEELTYIFKHTNAAIFLTLNKPLAQCDFGEEMQYILSMGTQKEISDESCDYMSSRETQEYWKKTGYMPSAAEAAWLIKQDKSLTLEEKHKAWKENLTNMPDCAFDSHGIYDEANIDSVHTFLSEYMAFENRLLEQFYQKETNAVYTYKFWSDEGMDWVGEDGALYADFEGAKAEFMDDAGLDPAFAQFSKRYIGAEDKRIHLRMHPDGTVVSVAEDRFICDAQKHNLFYDVFFGMDLALKNKKEDVE